MVSAIRWTRRCFGRAFPGFLWQASPYEEQALQLSGTKLPLLRSASAQNGKQVSRGVSEVVRQFEERAACQVGRYTCLQPEPETARPKACACDACRIAPLGLEVECDVAVQLCVS